MYNLSRCCQFLSIIVKYQFCSDWPRDGQFFVKWISKHEQNIISFIFKCLGSIPAAHSSHVWLISQTATRNQTCKCSTMFKVWMDLNCPPEKTNNGFEPLLATWMYLLYHSQWHSFFFKRNLQNPGTRGIFPREGSPTGRETCSSVLNGKEN